MHRGCWIYHFLVAHNSASLLAPPPPPQENICIRIVFAFAFAWDDCNTKKNDRNSYSKLWVLKGVFLVI